MVQHALLARRPSHIDIADMAQLDRSSVRDIIRRLRTRGWVSSLRSTTNVRANAARLTERGQAVACAVVRLLHASRDESSAGIAHKRAARLGDALNRRKRQGLPLWALRVARRKGRVESHGIPHRR
jgi:DNA-binding MarR family transcriptional regulator